MKKEEKTKKSILNLDISIFSVSLTQKALFAKHLSVMIKSGMTITESLNISADSAQGRFEKIILGVLKSVQAGHSLASSFSLYPKVFSGIFISATQAGESSGMLDENLENIAEQLEKEKELVSKIKGAMFYPIVVLSAAFALGLAMAFWVLPKITPLFEGLKMDLPVTTRALIWFSHFAQDYGTVLFIGVIIFVASMLWMLRQKFFKPVSHGLLLKIPIVKTIIRNANIARFCRTLGMLLKSGLPINEALEITKDALDNYYYQKVLSQVSQRIGKGTKLSNNLSQHSAFFPLMVIRMIKVGEQSGKMEETLLYLAKFYEVEVDNATKTLSTAIEPVLLIFIGLIVAFLALSIITPIYNITGGIKR